MNLAEGTPVEATGEGCPQVVLVQDQDGDPIAIDLHPSGDLSLEEPPPEVVVPEAPVTFSQVMTYIELQASSAERERLRQVLGAPSSSASSAPPLRHRRVQADLRPLHRDQSSQAQLRPRITRLPSGGVSVEGVDFSFRHHGAVEEHDFDL